MFDLFRSRDKAVRAMLTGLLLLVALSMITYLIPGSGSGSGGSTGQNLVAEIGKEQVTSQQVSRVLQNVTQNRKMPPELLSIYVPQIVQQMISERAMAYEARRLGMQVTAEETDNAIIDTLPAQLIKDGKVDGNTLNALLEQQGLSLNDVKADTSRQLLVSRLRGIVSEGVIVSPREVENEYRRRNEKVKIEYAFLTPAKFQSQVEPTEAEMKSYFESHKSSFKAPEKRSLGIILLDPEKIGQNVQPSDAELKTAYNANQDRFRVPERVKVRHILLRSDSKNDAQVKAKAEDLLKQIKGGADFGDLAKKNSEDPGSAAKGGELDWIVRGQTVPEFEKNAFSLQPGQTSDLVKTQYGYHLLQVEAKEAAHLRSFDEAKPELAADYKKREANKQMQALSDKAVAELRKDPLHPEKAAAAVGTTAIRADNVQAGDPIPQIGVAKEFDDAVGSLRKGEVTPGPIVLPGNKVAIVSVTDFQAPHQASLEEAKNEVRNKVTQDKLHTILDQKANELLAKAKSMGGDLAKAAKEMGFELKTSPDFDRQGAIEGVGSASTAGQAFTLPVNSVFGPVTAQEGRLIGKLISKTDANMANFASQSASVRDDLKQKKARERAQLFEEGLRKRLEQEGKLKIHQDVLARLMQNYSGRS